MKLIKLSQYIKDKKVVCPICGKPMNESYLGKQYCYDCEQKLKGEKKWKM